MTPEIYRQRLYDRSIPEPNSGCWLWLGPTYTGGYGSFGIGRANSAHRSSWILHRGAIPPGMSVCHHCDTPACVNPDHLFLGTQAQNLDDMTRKGRRVYGGPAPERSRSVKLTREQAAHVLVSPESGAALARRFGVQRAAINKIRRREHWKDLCI